MDEVIDKTYDEDVDAAYFRFSRNRVAETVEIEEPGFEDYIVDIDEQGIIIGVEVLNYSDHATDLHEDSSVLSQLIQRPEFHSLA